MPQLFQDVLIRQSIQHSKEQELENIASQINSIDDLFAFYTDIKGDTMMNHKQKEGLLHDVQTQIQQIMELADKNNIDIPKTMQRFIRARDENQVFENIAHLQKDIKQTIFQGLN